MYLIIGLGNPEPEYSRTRHNMGFDVINMLAKKYEIELSRSNYHAIFGSGIIEGEKVILVKPQTFMNASGEAIKKYVDFYKISLEKVLVIYDDMDIEPGIIKIRKKGGAGSHNGMKSVVAELNSEDFARIRVGIGTPKFKDDSINYVIGAIPKEEIEILDEGTTKATEAMLSILKDGIDNAMNKFN